MKVLVVSHLFPSTANQVSGIFVKQQVHELIKQGCEVKVISPVPWTPFPVYHFSGKWTDIHKIPAEDEIDGINVIYPRYLALPKNWLFARSGNRMYTGIKSAVREIHKAFPFDLIHAHVALPDGYAAMLLAEDYRIPFVVTIHGKDVQQSVHINQKCQESLSTVLDRASKTVFVSNKLKSRAEKIFGRNSDFTVVSNGINPASILKQSGKRTHQKSNKVILSVSNLVRTKGIDHNLLAINQVINTFPALRYHIVGDGPEKEFLRILTEDLKLSKKVTFLGKQPHEQVLAYMDGCDIFSLPSWQEGFGIVYLEAMALGKPVIGCRGEGIEDFVEHKVNGILVKPKDLDDLVKGIAYILDHPDEAKEMGRRARELVISEYTWDQNARKTLEQYQAILHNG